MAKLKITPPGKALHAYVSEADSKFNPDNPVYKLKLVLNRSDEGVSEFLTELDKLVDEAWESETKDMPVVQRKQWDKFLPYEDVLDQDTGEPTGQVAVKFKQNKFIKRKATGQTTEVKIMVQDAKGKRVTIPVFGGDTVRVGYSSRPSRVVSSKKIGLRLDFQAVRILAKRSRDDADPFGGAEDGWTAEDHGDDDFSPQSAGGASQGAGEDDGGTGDF